MRKIIHISDLHFGRENLEVVEALLQDMHVYQPDLVIVSGDLTQRARKNQFIKAAHFLNQIPFCKLVVPGNHDVPLYDVARRFLVPFNRYVRYIDDDFFPIYRSDQVVVIGLNTAYSFTWKSGRITLAQLEKISDELKEERGKLKMLVIHHPFHELFSDKLPHKSFTELGIDIIFSGHLHRASAKVLENHVALLNHRLLLVQAGTAVSRRLRGENNSFNILEVNPRNELSIIVKEYDNRQFVEKSRSNFIKENEKWHVIGSSAYSN